MNLNKPGIATTELWMTLAVQVYTVVQAILGNLDPHTAGIITAIVTGAYTICRTFLKAFGPVVITTDDSANPDPAAKDPATSGLGIAGKVVVGLLAIGMCFFLAGCPSFPVSKQVAEIDIAYAGAADAITIIAPSINAAQRKRIADADDVAYRAVKAVDAAAAKGQPVPTVLLNATKAAVAALEAELTAATPTTPHSATAPATRP